MKTGQPSENSNVRIKDFVPLASLKDLEFATWDLFSENAYEAAVHANVLSSDHLDSVK